MLNVVKDELGAEAGQAQMGRLKHRNSAWSSWGGNLKLFISKKQPYSPKHIQSHKPGKSPAWKSQMSVWNSGNITAESAKWWVYSKDLKSQQPWVNKIKDITMKGHLVKENRKPSDKQVIPKASVAANHLGPA
jgi:hypothetical protein